MKTKKKTWSKTELQVYTLLLCANIDKEETKEELDMIKSKVPEATFEEIYKEFHGDSEKKRLKKVEYSVHLHEYSNTELIEFRKEIRKVFLSDGSFKMMEQRLDWILDNIVY